MKRFITYLYEYEKGQKTKNTGFIRVDERNGKVIFQISVRNFIRSQEKGEIYAYVWENGLQGIEIGKLTILNSQTDVRLELDSCNIKDTGISLDQVVGIGLVFPNNGYMASCWDDAYAEAIGSGRFRKRENEKEPGSQPEAEKQEELLQRIPSQSSIPLQPSVAVESSVTVLSNESVQSGEPSQQKENVEEPVSSDQVQRQNTSESLEQENALQAASYELTTYQKMELSAIKNLPSPNWYLCNNTFLVHGFFNYGYLVLKKTTEAGSEKTYLGVPGIFEKPEMVMATLFGFPEFQTLSKEISSAKMEEIISVPQTEEQNLGQINRNVSTTSRQTMPKTGAFGCWLIPIQK
ncbi:MAG: DUF6128 domain-containing protein [Agathobacter sp.]